MKPILNTEDIRKLKTDERLIECSCGKVNYYRFLCFHPRNTNYVILLNHCEEPERFFIQNLIDRFYTNYTSRDIITYRRDYAIKKLKEFEQALSELGDKDELCMRYALRNQDKIAAAYSSEYLKEHIIGSLDSYFNVPRSQEEVEDFIYSSCVCYSTNQGNYPIMQINDIADDNAMLEFAWIGTQYDVIKLAFLGRMKG